MKEVLVLQVVKLRLLRPPTTQPDYQNGQSKPGLPLMRSAIDTGWKQPGTQCGPWLVGTYRDNQLSRTEHAHALLSCV